MTNARKILSILVLFCGAFLFTVLSTGTIETRLFEKETDLKSAFLGGILPSRAPVPWKWENVYGSIQFDSPFMTRAKVMPGGEKIVALGVDRVWVFDWDNSNPKPLLALDKSTEISNKGSGFIGIAFHPEFNEVSSVHYHEVYIYYTIGTDQPFYNILSKFKFSEDLRSIDSSSEEILIQQYDRSLEHAGGAMFFDKDGFLNLTLGDEGSVYSGKLNTTQAIDNMFFGGIIRIDVDMDETRSHPIRRQPQRHPDRSDNEPASFSQGYYIPNENPWVDESGNTLEEFIVIGIRSPHTAFYDTLDGRIWVGDVGNASWEEISVYSPGSNGMWPYFEGPEEKEAPPADILGNRVDPIHYYDRDDGVAIIAGFIYRGEQLSKLNESFVFCDYEMGSVWAYNADNDNPVSLLTRGVQRIVDFFPCPDDGICALHLNGRILRLKENQVVEEAPMLLSEVGAFEDLVSLMPTNGIIPYDINAPLWSDGSLKRRWFALPDTSKIGFDKNDPWTFPVGSVLVKHFELPINEDSAKRLETRFFVIDLDHNGYGLTYRWNAQDTEAMLIGFEEEVSDTLEVLHNGLITDQVWDYPTRGQCLQCHNDNAGYVLGVKTGQMNRDIAIDPGLEPSNQLELWEDLEFFDSDLPSGLPKFSHIGDSTYDMEHRVKSYLDANCSHCHQPYGVETNFDARFSTPLHSQYMINHETVSDNSVVGNHIISIGDLETSELWIRDASLGDNKMPPVAKNVLDDDYLHVLSQWIESLMPLDVDVFGELYVFPNPVKNRQFRVVTEKAIKKARLIDVTGREVPITMDETGLGELIITITGTSIRGVYHLILQTDTSMKSRKIVIDI
jgi:glucose/arabinose dehydrogenase/mono/diheme cytochrome c family protein